MVEDKDGRLAEPGQGTPENGVTAAMDESDTNDGAAAAEASGAGSQLEALQAELATLSDRHLRLAAEFDNYRKRTERERADNYTRAQGDLVRRLLEPIDDLERVGDYTDTAAAASILEGIQLVERKLLQSLNTAGLEAIDPAGQVFDPNAMEAIGIVATDDPAQDGLVADVYQKGYRFSGHLVRPARVRVYQHED
ncbi:MAG TPA: nucleotide exchange factor GrpE [Longimicrobiales bacterium]|nr:nucleotide exchange factor GrpE [Longimicrobiales bacterium]